MHQIGSWDILGLMVFGQAFGYVEKGRDFDGTLKSSSGLAD